MFNHLPVWGYVFITLFLTQITIASVTIYLHRHQSHRALDLHPAWVETDHDPHSPQQRGVLKVLLEGTELYRAEAENPETLMKYGHETPDDWIEKNLYSAFPLVGVSLMFALNVLLFGPTGITIWAVQMAWIPFFAAGVINGVGHWWGYRNYESADASRNILPFGLIIGGEELHNNHHAFAGSARFSSKWYEMDSGWYCIRCLQMFKLARVKKVAPRPAINPKKNHIDLDTVHAVVSNRLHVMSHYARDVLTRVYKEERSKANIQAKKLLQRGRRCLVRHEFILDNKAKQRLQDMLADNEQLQIVYEYKQRLQELWQEKTATQESLKKMLQEWCQQAEQTGVKALEEFAMVLRGYTLQHAV